MALRRRKPPPPWISWALCSGGERRDHEPFMGTLRVALTTRWITSLHARKVMRAGLCLGPVPWKCTYSLSVYPPLYFPLSSISLTSFFFSIFICRTPLFYLTISASVKPPLGSRLPRFSFFFFYIYTSLFMGEHTSRVRLSSFGTGVTTDSGKLHPGSFFLFPAALRTRWVRPTLERHVREFSSHFLDLINPQR